MTKKRTPETKKRTPEAHRTRIDTKLSLRIQQSILIDLVNSPQKTPGQLIADRKDGLYGNLERGDPICQAVKSKVYYYRDLKQTDEAAYWELYAKATAANSAYNTAPPSEEEEERPTPVKSSTKKKRSQSTPSQLPPRPSANMNADIDYDCTYHCCLFFSCHLVH